jgi:hypothetical protein
MPKTNKVLIKRDHPKDHSFKEGAVLPFKTKPRAPVLTHITVQFRMLVATFINSERNIIYESEIIEALNQEYNKETQKTTLRKIIYSCIKQGYLSDMVRNGKYYYVLKRGYHPLEDKRL